MTDALQGLSKEKADGYLNYWAVKGLLSRVYLNMGKYQEAYDAAVDDTLTGAANGCGRDNPSNAVAQPSTQPVCV